MEALNKQLEALEKKYQEITQKKEDLEREEVDLERERERLYEERLKLSGDLAEEEEYELKRELTAVGELLELQVVGRGSLRVSPEEPEAQNKSYSIHMVCNTETYLGLTGLYVNVVVKTKNPKVEAVMRSLFEQEGEVQGRSPSDLYWDRDWDYHTRIKLTTHEALS